MLEQNLAGVVLDDDPSARHEHQAIADYLTEAAKI
jgi:hypothetical protein